MLTVAQILPEMHSGGVEKGTLEVAQALGRAGHRSIVISGGGRLVPQLEEAGTQHIAMPVGRKSLTTLALVGELREVLRHNNVDVLHARSRVPAWLSVLALRRFKGRKPAFITTVHGMYSVNRFSRVMTRGDRVVCVSKTIRDYVCKNYKGVDRNRLTLIYRGVDPAEYRRGFRAEPAWETEFRAAHGLGERPLVLLAGRLTRLKGHKELFAVMEQLRSGGSDAVGLIVGGEDPRRAGYAAELREACSNVPNVVMLGHRSDLREIMSISAVVVSLSTHPESFGRTVLESLSLGVPVAGYDHGGVGEILDTLFPDGKVPVGATDVLFTTVQRLLSGPQTASIGENSDFTLRRMLQQTLDLYSSVGQAR